MGCGNPQTARVRILAGRRTAPPGLRSRPAAKRRDNGRLRAFHPCSSVCICGWEKPASVAAPLRYGLGFGISAQRIVATHGTHHLPTHLRTAAELRAGARVSPRRAGRNLELRKSGKAGRDTVPERVFFNHRWTRMDTDEVLGCSARQRARGLRPGGFAPTRGPACRPGERELPPSARSPVRPAAPRAARAAVGSALWGCSTTTN